MSSQPIAADVECIVDGERVITPAGRSVAAVLMLEEHRIGWRRTRFGGRPRGQFCGIGACFDCLVTVDGRGSLRGCLVEIADGMRIDTAGPMPTPAEESHDE